MEIRSLTRPPEIDPTKPLRLFGYAAVWNSPSRVITEHGRTFREEIQPGTFTRSLKSPPLGDIVALWQHGMTRPPLGRTPNTLTLAEDATGLRFVVDLPESAADIFEAVRRGDVKGVSFGMGNEKANWSIREGMPFRSVYDADLREMSLVIHPAYPASAVGTRSLVEIPVDVAGDTARHRRRLRLAEAG